MSLLRIDYIQSGITNSNREADASVSCFGGWDSTAQVVRDMLFTS